MLAMTHGLNILTFRIRKKGLLRKEDRTCLIGFKDIRTVTTLKNSFQANKSYVFQLNDYVATFNSPPVMDNIKVSCIQSMTSLSQVVIVNNYALFIVDLIYDDYMTGTMYDVHHEPSIAYLEDLFKK
jgi:hypothetical protein